MPEASDLIHRAIAARVGEPPHPLLLLLHGRGADVVIEFVSKEDAMSRRLLRNKDDVFPDYTLPSFDDALGRHFAIARRQTLGGSTRTLFYARHRDALR